MVSVFTVGSEDKLSSTTGCTAFGATGSCKMPRSGVGRPVLGCCGSGVPSGVIQNFLDSRDSLGVGVGKSLGDESMFRSGSGSFGSFQPSFGVGRVGL